MKKKTTLLIAMLCAWATSFACWTEITIDAVCLTNGSPITATGHRYEPWDWDNSVSSRFEASYNGGISWSTVSYAETYTFASFPGETMLLRYKAKEHNYIPNGANQGEWYVSDPITIHKCIVLAIVNNSFAATKQGSRVELTWQTDVLDNTDHFDVERSTDGVRFVSVTTVDATGASQYRTYDTVGALMQKQLFYRLHVQDLNGNWTYSPIIRISLATPVEFIVSPNPTTDYVTVSGGTEPTKLQLFNMYGKILLVPIAHDMVDLSMLRSGTYLLRATVVSTGEQRIMRIVKL